MNPILGILCLIFFILYLIKVSNDSPYITNFGKDVSNRNHIINIRKGNLVSDFGSQFRSEFYPTNINTNMGDTIIFKNNDIIRHTVEIGNINIQNSNILQPGDEFSITINQKDDISFRSSLYKFMNIGLIQVIPRISSSESLNIEGAYTEVTNTEGENKKRTEQRISFFKNIILLIKNYINKFLVYFYNIYKIFIKFANFIKNRFQDLIEAFYLYNKVGLRKSLKKNSVKKGFKFLGIIIFIIFSILMIYKFVFNPKIYIPIYGGNNLPIPLPTDLENN